LFVKADLHVSFGAAVRTIMQVLGSDASVPIIADMEIKSDNPEHGFQFPGQFELSAMGAANIGLEHELPQLLHLAGIQVLKERITWKTSSNGKYVSVKLVFMAESREQLDLAHTALRDHPEVKWTL
jgi:putative lipoic acid-binding regulatory protein